MDRDQCHRFLAENVPRMGLRWQGYRRVSGQVCKRLSRRIHELGLTGLSDYSDHLQHHPDEWRVLEALCRITVSRFYRDRDVFNHLVDVEIPALATQACEAGRTTLRAWSAGCASGEEPYTLAILWKLALQPRFPTLSLDVTATDANPQVLARARAARFLPASYKELPTAWRKPAFEKDGTVRQPFRELVSFTEQDIRQAWPAGPFDLVLCRNLVCTYLDEREQVRVLSEVLARLRPDGVLVIGREESLPRELTGLVETVPGLRVYRRDQGL
ncbi:MAG: CheR family methyltransferase [Myxococcota bacterium]